MRRSRSLLLTAAVGVALLAPACGVTADTTAATVVGEAIPVEDVTTLVEDPLFNGGAEPVNESTEDGELARSALMFLIEREVWLDEMDRWGLTISDGDRADIAEQLDEQAASGSEELRPRTRELLIDYNIARTKLSERFASLDPDDDADLRRLYDSFELQWHQVCLTVVQVPTDQIQQAQARLDDDAEVEELPELVDGAEVVADPSQGCFAEVALTPELRADLDGVAVGANRGVVLADDGSGGVNAYAYRLQERRFLGFDEAREQLVATAEGLAQQGPAAWVQLLTMSAQVNPRYGSDVVRSPAGIVVAPPPAPQAPRGQRIADAIAAASAASAISAAGADGSDAATGS